MTEGPFGEATDEIGGLICKHWYEVPEGERYVFIHFNEKHTEICPWMTRACEVCRNPLIEAVANKYMDFHAHRPLIVYCHPGSPDTHGFLVHSQMCVRWESWLFQQTIADAHGVSMAESMWSPEKVGVNFERQFPRE